LGSIELAEIGEQKRKEILQFYLNNQEMIRYHGERMWDSMKIFGLIVPASIGIITILSDYLTQNNIFGKEIAFLFIIPISFTLIFWFNSHREYLRFLEYAQMSWRAERVLGFHDPQPKLNDMAKDDDALVIKRFREEPRSMSICGKTFWTTLVLFFGTSFLVQLVLLHWLFFTLS
jgi:hypothetical protein